MKFRSIEEIEEIVQPVADNLGLEIVEIAVKEHRDPSVTFFIDKADPNEKIDLDTCALFHESVDPLLDEADISFGEAYTLNVSSPGLDRPFKKPRDFERAIGEKVECKLYAPMKGKKFFEGVLTAYDGNTVTIEFDGKEEKINLSQVAKINKAIDFE